MTSHFLKLTAVAAAVMVTGWGCSSSYVPLIHTGSSLNIYNTYWDKFDGRMEIGRIYHYSNRKYDRKLHLRAEKILADGRVVVGRRAEQGEIDEVKMEISEECRFLISTSYPYADGSKLREGDYRCVGNERYEAEDGSVRTVYVLSDIRYPGSDSRKDIAGSGNKETHKKSEVQMIRGNSPWLPASFPKNSLNIYNTYWDHFTGSLETEKIYDYRNAGFCRALHYIVRQSEPGLGILVIRKAQREEIEGKLQDMCADAVFLVVSGHSYADGESLRDGDYKCLGTYKYGRGTAAEQTLYVLMDVQNPGTLPADLKRTEAGKNSKKKTEFSI